MVFSFGCETTEKRDSGYNVSTQNNEILTGVKKATEESLDNLVASVKEIREKVAGSPLYEELLLPLHTMSSTVEALRSNIRLLEMAINNDEGKDEAIAASTKENTQLKEDNVRLSSESHKWVDFMLGMVVVGSIITFSLSVFLFLSGIRKVALALGSAGLLSAGLGAAFITYWNEIAVLGYVFLALTFLFVVWQVVALILDEKKKKDILVGGVRETVATTEVIKTELTDEAKYKLFSKHGVANKIQSDATKRLVQIEKTSGLKLDDLSDIVKNTKETRGYN